MLKLFTLHRYLLWQFTRRQIEQRHRGSALGILWSLLQPLLVMGIYTVVFGVIFQGKYSNQPNEGTTNYALGVFLSITIFQTVSEIIINSVTCVVNQPNLVKKIIFPLEVLPLATLGATFYQFVISMVLVLVGFTIQGDGLSLKSLFLPLTLMPLIPLGLGLALILSSLGVFLRDLQHAAGPASMMLMYASAVFYSADKIPSALWEWLKFNPLIHVVEQARSLLLLNQDPDWSVLAYSFTFGVATLVAGVFIFRKLKPAFADVL